MNKLVVQTKITEEVVLNIPDSGWVKYIAQDYDGERVFFSCLPEKVVCLGNINWELSDKDEENEEVCCNTHTISEVIDNSECWEIYYE